MKKAIVLMPFKDKEEGVARNVGDSFSCSDERADYLVSLSLVKAEKIEEAPKVKRVTKKKSED